MAHIGAEPRVWARFAAIRRNEAWHVRLLELTSGAAPPSWEARVWRYPWALFAATVQTGQAACEWLRTSKVTLGENEICLPEMATSLTWERRQSCSVGRFESLEWPVTEVTLARVDISQAEPQGHLVSPDDAPSFVNFYTAAACFFWRDRQPVGGQLPHDIMYGHQDTRARLNSVRIADEEVEIEVEGRALGGMAVELAGDCPGPMHRIADPESTSVETVRFALNDGLPPGAWALVRSGGEWIDRRFLVGSWARGAEAGVEFVVEPQTKLEAFLANREGPQVEFKFKVPEKTDDGGKFKVMKTVCAFANGEGGSILFGIDDDHNLVGLPALTIDRLKDQLTQTVGSWVEPRPDVDFETLAIDGRDTVVLELRVKPGAALYGCARPGDIPAPYIRHYATSVRARPAEIEKILAR